MIKYDENLVYSSGGFVTSKGNIIILNTNFEDFAMKYCLGSNYDMEDSELNSNELEMFKIWVEYYFKKHLGYDNMYSNFLVQVLGFDMIDSGRKMIITSSDDFDNRFYEYILSGWRVVCTSEFVYKNAMIKKKINS